MARPRNRFGALLFFATYQESIKMDCMVYNVRLIWSSQISN